MLKYCFIFDRQAVHVFANYGGVAPNSGVNIQIKWSYDEDDGNRFVKTWLSRSKTKKWAYYKLYD